MWSRLVAYSAEGKGFFLVLHLLNVGNNLVISSNGAILRISPIFWHGLAL
jgi:hypothetical protein